MHYTVSLPDDMWHAAGMEKATNILFNDYRSTRYFGMIRHFRRHIAASLVCASPAIDKVSAEWPSADKLQPLSDDTYYAPYATTLRMSDLLSEQSAVAA